MSKKDLERTDFQRCIKTDTWIRFRESMCPSFHRAHLTPWEFIFVQAPINEAKEVIYLISGEHPDTLSCGQHGSLMYDTDGVRDIGEALMSLTYGSDCTGRVINWDYANHILASAQHKHLESFRKCFWEEKQS